MKARLRYIIILLCLFLGCGGMYARSKLVKTINILDTEFMEVVYAHVTNDTVLNKSKADYEILILGHNYNKYGGYGNFQLDSILSEDPLLECAPTFEDFQKLSRSLGKIRESMTLCHSDSTVSFYGNIFINYYNYKEKTPEIEWLLADSETEKIMGYECCKATAKWRGREWTAWYSDIPYPFDPWKFGGLPGLILKL